jgi:hypothetical protein
VAAGADAAVAGALAGGVLSGDDGVIGAWACAGIASNNAAAIANPFTRWCICTSGSEIKVQLVPRTLGAISVDF